MDLNTDQIALEFPSIFRMYKDGRAERLTGTETIPPSTDPKTGVRSKDIILSPGSGLSARIFLPRISNPTRKLPLLVLIHGGAFVIESPFSPVYNNHAVSLAAEANVVVLSVHYRRAPEHPLPIAYEDSWEAVKWAAAHYNRNGPEEWLNDHADFQRAFVAGDSAGANLAHYVVKRAGVDGLSGLRIIGLVSFHPFFGVREPKDDKLDKLVEMIFPTGGGLDDPRWNPGSDPDLGRLGCSKLLVFVAEMDSLADRAWAYCEALKKSGWNEKLEIVETKGEDHVFHLLNPTSDKAVALMKKVVSFLNHE